MNQKAVSLLTILLLSACTATQPPAAEQPSDPVADTAPAISIEMALDQTFSSEKMGISFRYPSSIYDSECKKNIPVVLHETEGGVDFFQSPTADETNCPSVVGRSGLSLEIGGIFAGRVQNHDDLQSYIQIASTENCIISKEFPNGDIIDVTATLKAPLNDPTGMLCNVLVHWNTKTGVAMFSTFERKPGAPVWPLSAAIRMPDGNLENGADYPIVRSITFLK